MELVNVGDCLRYRGQARVGLLRGLMRQLGAVAGVNSVHIGFVGLGRRQADALGGAGINVFDQLAVGGGELIEFVQPIADRVKLPLDVLLAGKGIEMAPEAFLAHLQRLFAGGRLRWGGGRSCRLVARAG